MKKEFLLFFIIFSSCSVTNRTESPASPPEEMEEQAIGVSPLCTVAGNADTRVVKHGYPIELHWGWEAVTEQQVYDYIESVIFQITFAGEEVRDAKREDVYESGGTYKVIWWTRLGVLECGTYEMGFSSEFKKVIFDGWDYYGPGTEHETVQDHCHLIIE